MWLFKRFRATVDALVQRREAAQIAPQKKPKSQLMFLSDRHVSDEILLHEIQKPALK